MKNILFIHQSAELYGSDKTILMFISNLDRSKYTATVLLPFDGPLKRELEKNGIEVIISPILKLYRKMFTLKGLLNFYKEYKEGLKKIEALHRKRKFDLVYSHTLASLIGLVFARKNKIKHLWHVQEIIARPVLFNKGFKALLGLKSNHKIIYDSKATMDFWIKDNAGLTAKSDYIWNGLDLEAKPDILPATVTDVRQKYFNLTDDTVVIGLFGRINSWKGQLLLLEAFKKVYSQHKNIKLVYIGSAPPNQEWFEENLKAKVEEYGLAHTVTIIPFQEDIWKFWQSIDIAVVPSTEPEPFGMVAIEAMSCGKPVVAANHGGLAEIILHNETGYLFKPNDADDLAMYLEKLIINSQAREEYGQKGEKRVEQVFSLKNHIKQFEDIFIEMLH
jgi:glycosyltransferase involved in cell wall biosynthesis